MASIKIFPSNLFPERSIGIPSEWGNPLCVSFCSTIFSDPCELQEERGGKERLKGLRVKKQSKAERRERKILIGKMVKIVLSLESLESLDSKMTNK